MDIGFQRIITCSKTEFEQKFRNSAFRNYSSKHYLWFEIRYKVRDESLRNMYINSKLKVELCLSIASMHIYHCLTSVFKCLSILYVPKLTFAVHALSSYKDHPYKDQVVHFQKKRTSTKVY